VAATINNIVQQIGNKYCTKILIFKISGIINISVKVRLNRGETRSVKIGRGVRKGCCLSPIMFNLYSECLTKEALEGFGDFKIGRQGKEMILSFERGSSGSHYVESSLWKRLWTCRKTDY
jgi:hypothetical protein